MSCDRFEDWGVFFATWLGVKEGEPSFRSFHPTLLHPVYSFSYQPLLTDSIGDDSIETNRPSKRKGLTKYKTHKK